MMAGVDDVAVPALRTEVIGDPELFSQMQEEWDDLLCGSRSGCLFLTWEWLHTWWKHLSAGRELNLVAVRRGDRLVALAPCKSTDPQALRLRPLPALEFL